MRILASFPYGARAFAFGVVVALGMQFGNGWWLDARERIGPMQIAVAIGAFVAGAVGHEDAWWLRIATYCGGLMAAWFAIVAVWGGANLFPIVLAIAAWKSAVPVLIGASVGYIVSTTRS
jgi:hypothetical protein